MHMLIVGRTMSGKTTFATRKANSFKRQGVGIIVLDPFLSKKWNADFLTDDTAEFLDVVWNSRSCAVFVDESGAKIGRYNVALENLATRGRHWGHKCFFISQRAKQLSTTLRSQCSELAIFKQSKNDSKDLADEFVEPVIEGACGLNNGEFYYVRPNKETLKLNIFEMS